MGRNEVMETLTVKNLTKKFGEKTVLRGVSLNCEKGKIYGIVGYNGSGKTVLFKCICGFLRPEAGEIWINGKHHMNHVSYLSNMGIIIEEPAFIKNQSAYNNLKYLYLINHSLDRGLLFQVLERVGLNPKDKKKVGKYSMGMKQRLAIAQAIMENPELLILDEPMNGLDKQGVSEIRALLLNLKREGKIILLASHNKEDIEILCDEVYEMDEGMLKKLETEKLQHQ